MRRKGIQGRSVFRKDRMPCDLTGQVDHVDRRRRQCGNVQGLANVARGVRSASVLVDKDAAGGEIQ
jgi:hypothetical protein